MTDWRPPALAGATAGVALSPLAAPVEPRPGIVAVAVAVLLLAALKPALTEPGSPARAWLGALVIAAAVAGLLVGSARLTAIDGGAFQAAAGRPATATGFVTAVPKRSHGEVRAELRTADGKLLVTAPEPVPDLAIGGEVRASGVLAEPDPFLAPQLRRHGIAQVLKAERIEPTGHRRGGPVALLDRVRARAERALGRGMRGPESALARGFVLGEDDRIDPRTVDDFKRSGLAHHLAVSGENVVLLAVLAMPFLALAGLSLRGRLVAVLVLIAIYVPVAGAGPSIQRAGAMGAAGIVAALAGRPRSRGYAVLLAAFATLAANPRASGDIGWQLSFAAVIGIFLWTGRIAALLADRAESAPWRRALAEGVAMTVAATIATAPLMAVHFERVSIASLPANLLALPAIAPAMWLGMLSAAAGQVPGIDALCGPLNALNQLLLAYVEQVAHWLAAPSWSVASVRLSGPLDVAAAYAALLAATVLALRAAERRRGLAAMAPGPSRRRLGAVLVAALVLALAAPGLLRLAAGGAATGAEPATLEVSILDVGQGDSILLDPPGGDPVLVDGGPPGDGLRGLLADHGVSSLAAAIVTHDQSDHAAGVAELIGRMPIGSLGYAEAGPELLGAARVAGVAPVRLAEGGELRSGELRLEVLWPPREVLSTDPNRLSLVILAEWRHFSILLTGDAEEEVTGVDPGPVDVLKVAHHGSADAGLAGLLDRVVPDLAVISVGAGNPYGHPAPETLAALRGHGVPALRTDEQGTIEIEAGAAGWTVAPGG
ncbi:MAG: ComEC/Rec2 family competence protein [Solirubrobacterales bacterium]